MYIASTFRSDWPRKVTQGHSSPKRSSWSELTTPKPRASKDTWQPEDKRFLARFARSQSKPQLKSPSHPRKFSPFLSGLPLDSLLKSNFECVLAFGMAGNFQVLSLIFSFWEPETPGKTVHSNLPQTIKLPNKSSRPGHLARTAMPYAN